MDTFRLMKNRGNEARQIVDLTSACPDCGCEYFNPGPRGGLAHNIRCVLCGSKFWFCPPFPAYRIDSDDSVFELCFGLRTHEILSGDWQRRKSDA